MCGCGSISAGGGYAAYAAKATAPVQQAPLQANPYVAQTAYGGGVQLPGQYDVNDGRVRDASRAQQTLAALKAATANLDTPEKARAAGYHPNPSAPDHWINDNVFATRNGYDLAHPATLMFEGSTLVGVMLSHNPQKGAPPDLGAGSWHTHGGTAGAEYAAHVWFNKPLQSAFGTETGDV
jgi:hypothetical protein